MEVSIKTLIIDDEKPARLRVQNLLQQEKDIALLGMAKNGREAITLIRDLKPELLLLDIQLKDMDGFKVLESIRNHFNGYIIFITAFDEYAIQAFEAQALDYLLKPFKNQRFEEAIQRARIAIAQQTKQDFHRVLQLIQKQYPDKQLIKVEVDSNSFP